MSPLSLPPLRALGAALILSLISLPSLPGCQGPSTEAPPPPPQAAKAPSDPIDAALAQAQALEKKGMRVEAYKQYIHVMGAIPRGDARREATQEKMERLGFLLGVPSGDKVTTHNLPPGQVDPERRQALQEARALFQKGLDAQSLGEHQAALEAYKRVLESIKEVEDPELYWNAYSRVDDLSPQAVEETSSTPIESIDPELLPYLQGEGEEGDDDPGAPARTAFMKGKGLMDRGQYLEARMAFRAVLTTLNPDDDPELYRAAKGHLADVEEQIKILNGVLP